MIIAYRLDKSGLINVVKTGNVDRYFENVRMWSPHEPEVVAVIKAKLPWLQDFKARFYGCRAEGRQDGWFNETPELLGYLAGSAVRDKKLRDRRHRLTDIEAREIFRLCHDSARLTDEAIGDKYGVSKITVGQIARGMSHHNVLARDAATPEEAPQGSVWVWEIANPGKKYLLRWGDRRYPSKLGE